MPLKAMVSVEPAAVNVPMTVWPTPPIALVVLSSRVTVLPAVAVVPLRPTAARLELLSHHLKFVLLADNESADC